MMRPIAGLPEEFETRQERFEELDSLQPGWQVFIFFLSGFVGFVVESKSLLLIPWTVAGADADDEHVQDPVYNI